MPSLHWLLSRLHRHLRRARPELPPRGHSSHAMYNAVNPLSNLAFTSAFAASKACTTAK